MAPREIPTGVHTRSPFRSAENDRLRETGFAGFLVLAVHVLRGLGERDDGCIEVDTVPGRDLVAGNRVSGPGLDRSEGATLDAGDLDVARDRIARHAQVMFERRLGGVFDDARF